MALTRTLGSVLILAVLHVCGTAAWPNGRIWAGNNATIGQYPWVVSVRVDNAHAIVGNIISDSHILTSGHDLSKLGTTAISAGRVSVRVGSINQYAGGEIVTVQSITIHPSYGRFLHDIAIITLSEPLIFTQKIAAIALASNMTNEKLVEGTNVSVTGWGLELSGASPYKLQQAIFKVLSIENCEYEVGYGYDSVLCLHHDLKQGISTGDEGGGVVANKTLVGVASFFFGGSGTKYPDISTRVSYYGKWITDVTGGKAVFV